MTHSSKRILIVDTRDEWLSFAKTTLSEAGYEVELARSIREAKEILGGDDNKFDLILADQKVAEAESDILHDMIWVEPDRRRRVVVVFPTQFVALVRTIPVVPQLLPLVTATPAVAQLPTIDIWVCAGGDCGSEHVTQVKLPVQQSLFICARNPAGVSIRFTAQITLPDGQVVQANGDVATRSDGEAFSIGAWSEPPSAPGVYRIDALVGTTIVGSTVITVVS